MKLTQNEKKWLLQFWWDWKYFIGHIYHWQPDKLWYKTVLSKTNKALKAEEWILEENRKKNGVKIAKVLYTCHLCKTFLEAVQYFHEICAFDGPYSFPQCPNLFIHRLLLTFVLFTCITFYLLCDINAIILQNLRYAAAAACKILC